VTGSSEKRPGEIALPFDPGGRASDAGLDFIGRIRSPWLERKDAPKNMRAARELGRPALIEIDTAYRPGLPGLQPGIPLIVLTFMHRARRDLIVQMPRHAEEPSGVFALRSPVRPNPIGLDVVRLMAIDPAAGLLEIDATDCLDGTPVIDLKPWLATTDAG
jgi:tRNA-Thr(GGU) m(6)t(6)A37 methyltransferase TsaA